MKVAEFHCWVERDEKGKYTGHFVKDGKEIVLESGKTKGRACNRLSGYMVRELMEQIERGENPAGPQPPHG